MPLTRYQKFCYKLLGKLAESSVTEDLKLDLERANMNVRPSTYLACSWMNTFIAIAVGIVISLIVATTVLPNLIKPETPAKTVFFSLILVLFPFAMGFMVYTFHLMYPKNRAKSRERKIDSNLPYALNFISAMSAAGVAPHEIFISLSKQGIYGEVKEEAARIARDVTLLGMDIVTALKRAMERTPSERFRDFLQGVVVTITSGGSLKPYFMAKAEQYMRENRQKQKTFLETLGVMAEAYVTAAVAGPLFVLIVISLLTIIQGSESGITFLHLFVFLILPLIHLGFALGVKFMTPEV